VQFTPLFEHAIKKNVLISYAEQDEKKIKNAAQKIHAPRRQM
jgi:hypothetical protein